MLSITDVRIVLAAGSEIHANLKFKIYFLSFFFFHKVCTLGVLLTTPPKEGVLVKHVKLYLQ